MKIRQLAWAVLLTAMPLTHAYSAQIGTIFACYACQSTGNTAIDTYLATGAGGTAVAGDGLLFAFVNSGASPLTGGVFTVDGTITDTFALPAIAAGGTFILVPGETNDGAMHLSGAFFSDTGSVIDTSDDHSQVNDSTLWSFTGMENGQTVTSGNFTAGDVALILPFRGNPSGGMTSFLGNGPSGDGGCSNCYFGPIAALSTPNVMPSGVPEPAPFVLTLTGFAALICLKHRRSETARN